MLANPFLAGAIARLPVVDGTDLRWCGTAATDGFHVYVNRDFLAGLSEADARFVLAHEYLHAILGHPDRRQDRDRPTWNMATDFAVNQTLVEFGFQLPESALYQSRYRGATAEAIYDALRSSGHHEDADRREGFAAAAIARLDGILTPEQRRQLLAGGGWDIQLDPSDPEVIARPGEEMPTELERRRIRIALAEAMRSAAHGRAPGFLDGELTAAETSVVAWEALLSHFIGGVRRSDYRLYPFNRKHVHRGLYLPTIGAPGPQALVVVIDTSGSINDRIAARFLGEVDRLRSASECSLTVLQVDAAVQSSQDYEPWESSDEGLAGKWRILGRGGTDFRPAFTWVIERGKEHGMIPDALIYLTDGYGSFPTEEPPWPVLWVVTGDGLPEESFPFGSVLRLPPEMHG